MRFNSMILLVSLFGCHMCMWDHCDVIPTDGCTCTVYSSPLVICSDLDLDRIPAIQDGGDQDPITLDLSGNNFEYQISDQAFGDIIIEELRISNNNGRFAFSYTALTAEQKNTLLYLILSNNSFQRVPNIVYVTSLKTFDLSWNDISILRDMDFNGLPSLHRLDLRGNPILIVYPSVSSNLGHLGELMLTMSNETTDITIDELFDTDVEEAFQNNIQILEIFDVHLNSVRFLKQFSNLISLRLSNCGLADSMLSKSVRLRKSSKTLKYINLASNDLIQIPYNFIDSCRKLEHLDLSRNKLISHYLTYNEGTFQKMKYLDLSHNDITLLSSIMFTHYPRLKYLDTSYNGITRIEDNIFNTLPRLEFLDLSGNMLTVLERSLFPNSFPQRLTIAIKGNHFQCGCYLEWLVNVIGEQAAGGVGPFDWYDVHNSRCVIINEELFVPKMLDIYKNSEYDWVFEDC